MISGRNEELPGKPLLYSTTKNFMDYFGINSADDLPKIKEILADQIVMPTAVGELTDAVTEEETEAENQPPLVVNGDGEIQEEVNNEDASDNEEPSDTPDEETKD